VRGCEGGVVELGVCTTPQLHYVVRGMWRGEACGMEDYYARLVREYRALSGGAVGVGGVIVDCANGVGGIAMAGVDGVFDGLVVVNRAGDGPLNAGCGADFVQKKRAMPAVFGGGGGGRKGAPIWASLDGDADRLVMYKEDPAGGGAVLLADGDRFSALTAMFLSRHMEAVGLGGVAIGVAQTAYSNGAATEYVAGLRGVEVVVAKTGVKHLEIAVNAFDVGIYWEPNGHGTVMYSEAFVRTLAAALDECGQGGDAARRASLNVLLSVGRLANQAVGDGVADLLLVLAMLAREGMSFEDWLGMYAERCSANLVVQVADKGVIATENCDRVVTAPAALRKAVDAACRGDGRRAFVRPSGTEDVVRVYAEAPAGCEAEAAGVALEIARAVHDTCAGVGGRP
jgi:phosphoacetylglucosamine mutase